MITAALIGAAPLLLAEINASIEVKIFKDWVIKGEDNLCCFVFKNTGTDPLPLARKVADFEGYQLMLSKNEHEKARQGRFNSVEQRGNG